MANINETTLPGVGIRHDFETKAGDRLGTITHRSGRRDLLFYNRQDPDACSKVVRLEEEESRALTELLGASPVTESLENFQQSLGDLTLDWLPITDVWSCTSCQVQDLKLTEKTGAVIVGVVRGGQVIPAPEWDFRLQSGDMAIIVGTPDGISQAQALLQAGSTRSGVTLNEDGADGSR
jgi:TrkA domain protein